MTRFYIAAAYCRKEEMKQHAKMIEESLGWVCTSQWLNEIGEDLTEENQSGYARKDIYDINEADVLVTFTEPPNSGNSRGGRHVEFGYALALYDMVGFDGVHVIGHRENVFHWLPEVTFHETVEEFVRDAGRDYAAV